jgi:translation initiation factor 2 gamma subunit (eIF-2gamma)
MADLTKSVCPRTETGHSARNVKLVNEVDNLVVQMSAMTSGHQLMVNAWLVISASIRNLQPPMLELRLFSPEMPKMKHTLRVYFTGRAH